MHRHLGLTLTSGIYSIGGRLYSWYR
jgi:hypothetical protein